MDTRKGEEMQAEEQEEERDRELGKTHTCKKYTEEGVK
jgi:hypothetical protein